MKLLRLRTSTRCQDTGPAETAQLGQTHDRKSHLGDKAALALASCVVISNAVPSGDHRSESGS